MITLTTEIVGFKRRRYLDWKGLSFSNKRIRARPPEAWSSCWRSPAAAARAPLPTSQQQFNDYSPDPTINQLTDDLPVWLSAPTLCLELPTPSGPLWLPRGCRATTSAANTAPFPAKTVPTSIRALIQSACRTCDNNKHKNVISFCK